MKNNFLKGVHHIAIICSNYEKSKEFYTQILELTIIREVYREQRQSYKLDLALNDEYIIELFSFPNPPHRSSRPESCGLRHLAFSVNNLDESVANFKLKGIELDRKSTRLNSSHIPLSRMPSSA